MNDVEFKKYKISGLFSQNDIDAIFLDFGDDYATDEMVKKVIDECELRLDENLTYEVKYQETGWNIVEEVIYDLFVKDLFDDEDNFISKKR